MPLRFRLIFSVILALLAGLALAVAVTIWQARGAVTREVGSALAIARQAVESALAILPASADPTEPLRRQIIALNGDRHVRGRLLDGAGLTLSMSVPAPTAGRVPAWFVRAVGGEPPAVLISLPDGGSRARAVSLEGDTRNEVLEAWNSLRDMALVILALSLSAALLIWWSIKRALRPLDSLSAALQSVGAGEFAARLPSRGPSEIRVIAAAFNRMAEDLNAARRRNRTLHEQLLTAQESERAEIARDLHDDIGPLLFAITVDAAAAESAAGRREGEAAAEAAREIRAVVQQAHARMRAIINRLRPVGLAEFGIERAVENLIDFWRRRHPEVTFSLDLRRSAASGGDLVDVTAFRVIQEAVSNAMQHGRPSHVAVSLRPAGEAGGALLLSVVDDGRGGDGITPGFGLTGMRDRIEAVGGRLTVSAESGRGFRVAASLPAELGRQVGEARP